MSTNKSNPVPKGVVRPKPPPAPPKRSAPPIRFKLQEDKTTDYEYICNLLENVPITYYPALLIKLVEISYKRGVWQKGGASRTIKKVEEKIQL